MIRSDSWAGAIVRGRDGRKGRVVKDMRTLGKHRLIVHWDTDSLGTVSRYRVTMLRPPLGFQPIIRQPRTSWWDRNRVRMATIVMIASLLFIGAMAAYYLSVGAP